MAVARGEAIRLAFRAQYSPVKDWEEEVLQSPSPSAVMVNCNLVMRHPPTPELPTCGPAAKGCECAQGEPRLPR